MRVVSFGFRETGAYQTAGGEMFGANAAEQQLAKAALVADGALRWEILSSRSTGAAAPFYEQRLQERALSSFPREDDGDAVLLANPPSFEAAHRLRAGTSIPICTLVHSLWGRHGFAPYLDVLAHARPGDTLVASSAAAEQALSALLADAERTLGSPQGSRQRAILQVVRVPLGVEIPGDAAPEQAAARSVLQLPANAFVILYLGRLSETYKADLAPLLLAVSATEAPGRPTHCILAGQSSSDGYAGQVSHIAASCGLKERVAVIENFPEFLKSSLYAAADVCVAPADSIQETFGLAVLEAMAHARPVIAADWSGYRDLVEDGVTGYLLPTLWNADIAEAVTPWAARDPMTAAYVLSRHTVLEVNRLGTALRQLAGDPGTARKMGVAGQERARSLFAWPLVAKRFLKLWAEQLAAAHASNAARCPGAFTLDRVFRHYASAAVAPRYLLARIPDLPERATPELLAALGHRSPRVILSILEATANAPLSLESLEQSGFLADDLLWVAKKGLRRLVDPDAALDGAVHD